MPQRSFAWRGVWEFSVDTTSPPFRTGPVEAGQKVGTIVDPLSLVKRNLNVSLTVKYLGSSNKRTTRGRLSKETFGLSTGHRTTRVIRGPTLMEEVRGLLLPVRVRFNLLGPFSPAILTSVLPPSAILKENVLTREPSALPLVDVDHPRTRTMSRVEGKRKLLGTTSRRLGTSALFRYTSETKKLRQKRFQIQFY